MRLKFGVLFIYLFYFFRKGSIDSLHPSKLRIRLKGLKLSDRSFVGWSKTKKKKRLKLNMARSISYITGTQLLSFRRMPNVAIIDVRYNRRRKFVFGFFPWRCFCSSYVKIRYMISQGRWEELRWPYCRISALR